MVGVVSETKERDFSSAYSYMETLFLSHQRNSGGSMPSHSGRSRYFASAVGPEGAQIVSSVTGGLVKAYKYITDSFGESYVTAIVPLHRVYRGEYFRQRLRVLGKVTNPLIEAYVSAFLDLSRWELLYAISRRRIFRRWVEILSLFIFPSMSPWCNFVSNVVGGSCQSCPMVQSGLIKLEEDVGVVRNFLACVDRYQPVKEIFELVRYGVLSNEEALKFVDVGRRQVWNPDALKVLEFYKKLYGGKDE